MATEFDPCPECGDEHGSGVEYVGPFVPHHEVHVHGWRVPFIEACEHDNGTISFILDRRLAFGPYPVGPKPGHADDISLLIADVIAVVAGYASHPRENIGTSDEEWRERIAKSYLHPSVRPCRVSQITAVRTEED